MLAFLALFGALGASFIADGVLSSRQDPADSDEVEDDGGDDNSDNGAETESRLLLDWALFDNDADEGDDPDVTLPDEYDPYPGFDAGSIDDGMPVSDDIADAIDAAKFVRGGDQADILSGGDGADSLSGGAGQDQLTGRAGDDDLQGGAGDDILHGEDGDDHLFGGLGNDTLQGGAGQDALQGGAGDDFLAGHQGDDTLSGGDGADTVHGGEGADTASGGAGDDWLTGGAGNDLLIGGAGQDTLDGGTGDDSLFGTGDGADDGETDMLNGGAGDDVLTLGAGDWATGGDGSDSFVLTEIQAGDSPAQITDFLPGQDELVIEFDANDHPDPAITITPVAGSSDVLITLDGVPLAVVQGGAGLTSDLISLRPV
ncbi:calcium-binding protein [Pseudotabrizicola sp. L79]|uniref:calcium-binding protein n=1 Tax=Pseudotabrizicola sp. L79 TaxID=3118402 RepID=UPI002F929B96